MFHFHMVVLVVILTLMILIIITLVMQMVSSIGCALSTFVCLILVCDAGGKKVAERPSKDEAGKPAQEAAENAFPNALQHDAAIRSYHPQSVSYYGSGAFGVFSFSSSLFDVFDNLQQHIGISKRKEEEQLGSSFQHNSWEHS